MLRLRGRRGAPGTGLGTAVTLRSSNGIPMLPARVAEAAARRSQNGQMELADIVLVVREIDTAAGIALPWARIAGVVAEQPGSRAENWGFPSASGIPNLLENVCDDTLLLVDGDRGILLIDPDAAAVAAYQAERERIAPRKRVFLDFAHQHARTLDGREIHVIGSVTTIDEVRQAVDNGSDGLYIPAGAQLISPDDSDDEHLSVLRQLIDLSAGKPITIVGSLESISPKALLQASLTGDLTLASALDQPAVSLEQVDVYLDSVEEELIEEDVDSGRPRVALSIDLAHPSSLIDFSSVGRIIISGGSEESTYSNSDLQAIDSIVVAAAQSMVPVEFVISNANSESINIAVGLGVAGIIVPPDAVAHAKNRIREADTTSCRSHILAGPRDDAI